MVVTYEKIDSWSAVLAYVREHGGAGYHPPLNYAPVWVKAEVQGNDVLMSPHHDQGDPFTADESHLDRFRARKIT